MMQMWRPFPCFWCSSCSVSRRPPPGPPVSNSPSRQMSLIDGWASVMRSVGWCYLQSPAACPSWRSPSPSGHLDLAAGNLIGGIATAMMVLVLCDLFADRPLTYLVGSLLPVLEGLLVVLTVAAVLMGALLPRSVAIWGRLSPASLAIVVIWIGGAVSYTHLTLPTNREV